MKVYVKKLTLKALTTIVLLSIVATPAIGQSSRSSAQTEPANNSVGVWVQREIRPGGIIFNLIAAGVGALAAWFKYKEREFRNSLYKIEPIGKNERRNTILIVGMGGSGKTTLIRNLFEEPQADPRIATKNVTMYSPVAQNQSAKHQYYILDYAGQNIGSLIVHLLLEQKKPYSPIALGAINSIIFVVDLAEPLNPTEAFDLENIKNSWKDRVHRHVSEWSPTALNMIFGLVDDKYLKYVCLFINKMDLLPDLEEMEVIQEYQNLIREIDIRSRGKRFQTLIGSAREGRTIPELKSSLREYSIPL